MTHENFTLILNILFKNTSYVKYKQLKNTPGKFSAGDAAVSKDRQKPTIRGVSILRGKSKNIYYIWAYLYHENHGPVMKPYTSLFSPKIKKHRISMILNCLEFFQPFQRTQSRKLRAKVFFFFSPINKKKLIKEIIVTSCLEEIHLFSFGPTVGSAFALTSPIIIIYSLH